ncbi:MAG: hypothetical protein KDK97_19980, partial [Verrucomicrobiales bacterium]|nr:hypothetical protein [Verrucomicrobiales bacterium]
MSTLQTLRRHRRVLATVNLTAMMCWTLQSNAVATDIVVSGQGAVLNILANASVDTLTLANGARLNLGPGATLSTNSPLSQSWAGWTTGAGGISKFGPGDLIISGRMAHTGLTTFGDGTIYAGAANRATSNVLSDASTLDLGLGAILNFA